MAGYVPVLNTVLNSSNNLPSYPPEGRAGGAICCGFKPLKLSLVTQGPD